MISQTKNRVQAIKSKFENLNVENENLVIRKNAKQLCKQRSDECDDNETNVFDQEIDFNETINEKIDVECCNVSVKPNTSYLYSKNDSKRSFIGAKKSLTRQCSDPGKKLHRSHAFRCDRSQKIGQSPKRHGSCNGRSETSDFSLKMGERKLSRDRLKRLGNFLEDQMRKENFTVSSDIVVDQVIEVPMNSIPDKDVPKHILDQYAKVVKTKKEEKQDTMTDSGVSSETENLDDEKNNKVKKLMTQFEKTESKTETNLEVMNDLCASSETMRLERKNPHLILTDTLKKALKQPLPPGPPPKKPPRVVNVPIAEKPEIQKKDTKKMLEKLEQVLHKRETQNQNKNNIYDIAETDLSIKKPKEIHYLCTEILDITQRTLLPNHNASNPLTNCLNSLNCSILTNSTASLPYTRLSSRPNSNLEPIKDCCTCSVDSNSRFSTFLAENSQDKCVKCKSNDEKHDGFKCHLNCKCKMEKSEFFIDKEHIYDEPFNEEVKKNQYGTLNSLKLNGHSKSLEDIRIQNDEKIYDIPCDVSRAETPDFTTSSPKTDFQKLRDNFENGFRDGSKRNSVDTENITRNSAEIKRNKYADIGDRKFGTEITGNRKSLIENVDNRRSCDKPPLTPKPNIYLKKVSKSTENLADDFKSAAAEKRFGTDTKRYRKDKSDVSFNSIIPKKTCTQLDKDRENLNRLMNEIYETVTVACSMEDRKPGCFPTDQSDGGTSEDSVKLTRSLTEKRKNYVRRVSSRVAYLDQSNPKKTTRFRHQTSVCSYKSEIVDNNPYNTFRSWKSFRTSRTNLARDKMGDSTDSKFNLTDSSGNILSMKSEFDNDSMDKLSIDEKTGCVDIELPFEPRERGLFNVCLLVGLNYMTGHAYVKSVFPSQVQVPPHIENLIFPETAAGAQCYSLVLTDERGERAYGYCRRVLPEGASICLPLCYCLIGKYRAPGFYYKVLQEIESHHGSSEVEIHSILQQLFETDFPNPGEEITISYKNNLITDRNLRHSQQLDIMKCKTMPDMRRSNQSENDHSGGSCQLAEGCERLLESSNAIDGSDRLADGSEVNEAFKYDSCDIPKFLDLENNNGPKRVMLSLECKRTKTIKRPIEPRVDEDNLCTLLDSLGAGLVIKVFSSLLLERKVVIMGDKLSAVSGCLEALQQALYPLVWQQPLISSVPARIQHDVLEAPLPLLAGLLRTRHMDYIHGITFHEGMLIDLTGPSKVLYYQGDESTILPTSSYKSLKTSLQMESSKHKDRSEDTKTRNVMISEAFLRFFVDILGDFWKYLSVGEVKDGDLGKGNILFDKEAYIKNVPSKQNQYFLEWFTETAMFNHFIQNMCQRHPDQTKLDPSQNMLVDTPLPNFYQLLDERLKSRTSVKNVDKANYKSAVNKKVKLLKTKLRDLIT
ncbi:unnamed protein product [Diatraea saccharalis]|uniref:UDENN domain-containing protein n=1 Tax=Diatraea saccharalis TaxID=40085 RepID=A0A9N9RDC7_9NEOP|nr:unnamed protein product [Diatraea saccharalis]